jgi:2-polyprenyl-3-methyl-5-hydroxy-6-metoxy-1,4-benzoquinol methylase
VSQDDTSFRRLAAAYVRGRLGAEAGDPLGPLGSLDSLVTRPLETLSDADCDALIATGVEAGVRLHRFKRTMELPRVRRVLGILRGIQPQNLLDIGSGRGAFLWPLLDAFPFLPVTALDSLALRVTDLQAVRDGGVLALCAVRGDATALPFADRVFDVVTALEVLEHIPDTERALAEVCRVARRFVVVSVPSKADNNPEHIHLFERSALIALLQRHGAERVTTEYVLNHLIAVARVTAAAPRPPSTAGVV